MNCFECQENITPYIDNELDEKTTKEVKSHFDVCEKCRSYYKAESQLKLSVKNHFKRISAPDDLKANIIKGLDSSSNKSPVSRTRFLSYLQPYYGFAAAAVLLIALVSILIIKPWQEKTPEISQILLPDNFVYVSKNENKITIEGEVVCLCCEMHKKGAHAACRKYGHTYGVKADNGVYWTIMKNDKGADIIDHKELVGTRVRLTGWFYFSYNYIDLDRFEPVVYARSNSNSLALNK